jgi:hypothetical protein
LITKNPEQRVRAADVARRITESDPALLTAHASEIAAILAETPEPVTLMHDRTTS